MPKRYSLRLTSKLVLPITLIMLFASAPKQIWSQAAETRVREAGLSVFGGYSLLSPDYGPTKNSGFFVGGDYTWFKRFLSPSLEVRVKVAPGDTVGERTYGGGLRVEHQFARFHPYADFLVSSGTITFANPRAIGSVGPAGYNNSVVYSYGGGVDYDFTNHWAARVDFQQESWDLEEIPDVTLAPRVLSLGVNYRFSFGRDGFR
jgi:hypothetical protein